MALLSQIIEDEQMINISCEFKRLSGKFYWHYLISLKIRSCRWLNILVNVTGCLSHAYIYKLVPFYRIVNKFILNLII